MAIDLRDVPKEKQTYQMCLESVRMHGAQFEFVNEALQTDEMCLEAVKWDGLTLKFVKEQNPEICLAAVKRNGCALQYVEHQTPSICLEAVRENGYALEFVKTKPLKFVWKPSDTRHFHSQNLQFYHMSKIRLPKYV